MLAILNQSTLTSAGLSEKLEAGISLKWLSERTSIFSPWVTFHLSAHGATVQDIRDTTYPRISPL